MRLARRPSAPPPACLLARPRTSWPSRLRIRSWRPRQPASPTGWRSNTPDTTAGYANTIQVRLTDSGPGGHGNATGTYWESDIGYNTTASPITVDGTTVPANGWALLFPFVTATTTTLTTSATGGHLNAGSPITLTATVPSGDAGTVQFYDGTHLPWLTTPGTGGSYTYTYTPAAGSHVYTASFVPDDSVTRPARTRRAPPSWAARSRPPSR